nr:MAG TPA: hypothetical protein [Bacteriophage sp.]DAS96648.1 MAG TPA: hypothetical protein [Caudoviricetes sp.]
MLVKLHLSGIFFDSSCFTKCVFVDEYSSLNCLST